MTNTKTSSYNDVLDSARAKLRAAFDASPELQAEFVCAEDYAAFSLAEAERKTGAVSAWRAKLDDLDAEVAITRAGRT